MYRISYHQAIVDDIAHLGTAEKRRVKQAIDTKLATSPLVFGKPLQHSLSGLRSLRVGDYRVIFKLSKDEVYIVLIAHRSVVYSGINKRVI